MPSNKRFDRKNPKKKFEMEQGVPSENVPRDGATPRFEPERVPGRVQETEVSMAGIAGAGRVGPKNVDSVIAEPDITTAPLTVSPNHRSLPFYKRRAVTVEALQEATILEIDARAGTYYIKRFGHTYQDTSVEFRLVYDDIVWQRWNFQIGGVTTDDMYVLHSALPVRRKARLIVRNQSPETRLYEGVIDGWFNETAGVSEEKGGFQ